MFNNFQLRTSPTTIGDCAPRRRHRRRALLLGSDEAEFNFDKDLIGDFIGCANLVWSTHWPELPDLIDRVQGEMPTVRQRLSGRLLPSEDGDAVVLPVALALGRSGPADPSVGLGSFSLRRARRGGPLALQLADPAAQDGRFAVAVGVSGKGGIGTPAVSDPIPIGADVSSLVFLHALARPAA